MTSPSVIKTRMQTIGARTQYRNSFHCAYRIFTEEGIFTFWRGTTPRLARLVVSDPFLFFVCVLLLLMSSLHRHLLFTGYNDLLIIPDERRDCVHGLRANYQGLGWEGAIDPD